MIEKNKEFEIDGYSIYFDQIEQVDESHFSHDSSLNDAIKWSSEQLKKAVYPIVNIMDTIKNSVKDSSLDTIELSMQFSLNLKGEVPIFKIISAGSSSQMGIKLIWKNKS